MLRDLYDKYAGQGLEIYQVPLDADEHYWKTTADNLPWICVRAVKDEKERETYLEKIEKSVQIYSAIVRTGNMPSGIMKSALSKDTPPL